MRAGATGFADKASILSETAGARDKRKFFNGLSAWPAESGEDRMSLIAAARGV